MIVTNNDYLADKIRSLRSHGWTRDMKSTKQYNKFSSTIDPRFLFVNVGYNLRSSDLNASIGIEQLKKLKKNLINQDMILEIFGIMLFKI